jgi:hypothetical protein
MSEVVGSCSVCLKPIRGGERMSFLMMPFCDPVELCEDCANDMREDVGFALNEIDLDKMLSPSGNKYIRVSQKKRSVSKKELLKRKAQRKRK